MTTPTRPKRRHDLDALRGFAMLLGIGLHAALSFVPGFWPAEDATAEFDGLFDEFFHAVHGFRMPLFFLLSGFFTTMLWRRRGLRALLSHRFQRIALPLAIGMLTIIPAVNASAEWAIDTRVSDYLDESGDIWAAAFFGDTRAVEELLDRGVDVNAPNEDDKRITPLHLAAVTNDVEMASLLLERGADPTRLSDDGTAMDYAVFFGNTEIAEVLVEGGATDPRAESGDWTDVLFWDAGGDLEEVEDLGVATWLASFHHLWFLWFLLWLVAGFSLVALAVDRYGKERDEPAAWPARVMWALIPLTLMPQLAMGDGGAVPVFGPDTSTGLVPLPHVLAYYAVFFAFGGLMYGRRGRDGELLIDTFGRRWPITLPLALVVILPLAIHLTFGLDDPSWGSPPSLRSSTPG